MTHRSYGFGFPCERFVFSCKVLTDDFRVTDNADVMWFKGICYGFRGNIPETESGERARKMKN